MRDEVNSHKICFVGFGELGQSILNQISIPDNCKLVFFDDNLHKLSKKNSYPFKQYLNHRYSDADYYMCLGYNSFNTKSQVFDSLRNKKTKLPYIIHNSCYFDKTSKIGSSCYVFPMSNIDRDVTLSDGVLVNNSVTISHNCFIGEGSYISPGVTVCGNVKIGRYVFIGSGTVIRDGISIGDYCNIGMNSSVQSNLEPYSNVIGNPLKFLKRRFKL